MRIRSHPRAIATAHFQVWSIRRRSCRAPRVRRAPTCSTAYLNLAISALARVGTSAKARSLVQAIKSIAVKIGRASLGKECRSGGAGHGGRKKRAENGVEADSKHMR